MRIWYTLVVNASIKVTPFKYEFRYNVISSRKSLATTFYFVRIPLIEKSKWNQNQLRLISFYPSYFRSMSCANRRHRRLITCQWRNISQVTTGRLVGIVVVSMKHEIHSGCFLRKTRTRISRTNASSVPRSNWNALRCFSRFVRQ